MNNYTNQQHEVEINIKEMIWDLLEQWKAVLITSLVMALLVTGAKYLKEKNAYEDAIRERDELAQSGLSYEEQIATIYNSLPEEEKMNVEIVLNQAEWIGMVKKYMNESILLNTNPTNQRTLNLDYYINVTSETEKNVGAIVYGYAGYLDDKEFINSVCGSIAPEADIKYIPELIKVSTDLTGKGSSPGYDSGADGAMIEVSVVLPEDADPKVVEAAVTSALTSFTPELNNKISRHNIQLIKSSESYVYNSEAINNKNNLLYAINNLQNNSKNMQNTLSDRQKDAIESILEIRKESAEPSNASVGDNNEKASDDKQLSKPRISTKYMLVGFVMGTILYSLVYVILFVLKGRIEHASDVEKYVHARLFGETYIKDNHRGLSTLFHSRLIDRCRFRGYLDIDEQIKIISSSLEAVCKYGDIKAVDFISVTCTDDRINAIVSQMKKKGVNIQVYELSGNINEKELLDTNNIVYIVHKKDKHNIITKMTDIYAKYDKNILGGIFLGNYSG